MVSCTPFEDDTVPAEDIFVKFYGRNGLDVGRDIKFTPENGGFIMLGERGTPGSQDNEVLLIKADSAGNTIAEGTYGGDAGIIFSAAKVVPAPDGGFVVAGSRLETNLAQGTVRRMFTLKVNENLQPEESWGTGGFKFYGRSNVNFVFNGDLIERSPVHQCFDIKVHAGGYALIGSTNDVRTDKPFFNSNTDLSDIAVLILDFSGDTLFTQRVGYPGEDIGFSIEPLSSERFAIMGMTTRSAFSADDNQLDGQNVLFNIIDLNGETSTNKIFGSVSDGGNQNVNDLPVKMIKDGLGYLILTNDGESNAVIMKLTESGVRISTSNLTLPQNSNGRDIIRTRNGEYILAGSIVTTATDENNINRGTDMLVMNLSQSLEIRNDRIYHYGGRENDIANGVIQLASGNLVIMGTTDFENGNTMITLMKTTATGRLLR